MRKFFPLLFCLILILNLIPSGYAAEYEVIDSSEYVLDNGIRVVEVIKQPTKQTWANNVTRAKERSYYYDGTLIAVIEITGTFRFTGTNVSIVSKEVTRADTYDGWSFSQTSFTGAGGATGYINLTGGLSKQLIFHVDVDLSLYCDKYGNVS